MTLTPPPALNWPARLQALAHSLRRFPWLAMARTLRERFREDRLGLTASSLTFTTIMALVPFIAVVLAVFTAFPMFAKFQDVLQKWLIESLVPDNIARQVLGYLSQFAGKASKLGSLGVAFLLGTALALIFTIDRTLNAIWRVKKPRPLGQRVLVYWAAVTLGPLLLAVSLSLTSYAISASRGLVDGLPGGVRLVLDVLEFFLLAGGMAALYHYVPNTHVRWGHAWIGGLLVSGGIEVARKLLGLYLAKVPTYSAIYGTFATVPILLVWIYVVWVVVLLGAVITAYLPSLLAGLVGRARYPGQRLDQALAILGALRLARVQGAGGLTLSQLAVRLGEQALVIEPVLELLQAMDWMGLVDETTPAGEARFVLLVEPASTALAPLIEVLLLARSAGTEALWAQTAWATLRLDQALEGHGHV